MTRKRGWPIYNPCRIDREQSSQAGARRGGDIAKQPVGSLFESAAPLRYQGIQVIPFPRNPTSPGDTPSVLK